MPSGSAIASATSMAVNATETVTGRRWADQVRDGLLVADRRAEIASRQVGDPFEIAHHERPVQPELTAQPRDVFGRASVPSMICAMSPGMTCSAINVTVATTRTVGATVSSRRRTNGIYFVSLAKVVRVDRVELPEVANALLRRHVEHRRAQRDQHHLIGHHLQRFGVDALAQVGVGGDPAGQHQVFHFLIRYFT